MHQASGGLWYVDPNTGHWALMPQEQVDAILYGEGKGKDKGKSRSKSLGEAGPRPSPRTAEKNDPTLQKNSS